MSTILTSSQIELVVALATNVTTAAHQWSVDYSITCIRCGLTGQQEEETTYHNARGTVSSIARQVMVQGVDGDATTQCWVTVISYTVYNADSVDGHPTVSLFDGSVLTTTATAITQPGGSLAVTPGGNSTYSPSGSSTTSFPAVPVGQIVYGNGTSATSDGNLVWDPVNFILSIGPTVGQPNIFIGDGSTGSSTAKFSICIGSGAGTNATNINGSQFIGTNAGDFATNAQFSQFIGELCGNLATNANDSQFIGQNAGNDATNASNSQFIGGAAGYIATNASNSQFIGGKAGNLATNAASSIFIGTNAGISDAVDNKTLGTSWSILIGCPSINSLAAGKTINTGGFTNSIFLGGNASATNYANTANGQLYISDDVSNFVFNGTTFNFPASQGALGSALLNDGSGNLLWSGGTAITNTTTGNVTTTETVIHQIVEGLIHNSYNFQWNLNCAVNANTKTIRMRMGTTGTTSDTLVDTQVVTGNTNIYITGSVIVLPGSTQFLNILYFINGSYAAVNTSAADLVGPYFITLTAQSSASSNDIDFQSGFDQALT